MKSFYVYTNIIVILGRETEAIESVAKSFIALGQLRYDRESNDMAPTRLRVRCFLRTPPLPNMFPSLVVEL